MTTNQTTGPEPDDLADDIRWAGQQVAAPPYDPLGEVRLDQVCAMRLEAPPAVCPRCGANRSQGCGDLVNQLDGVLPSTDDPDPTERHRAHAFAAFEKGRKQGLREAYQIILETDVQHWSDATTAIQEAIDKMRFTR